MRALVLGLLFLLSTLFAGRSVARADAASTTNVAPADDQHGLVVLGLGSSVDVAWPLARAVYADASLRPRTLDEAHARVLVGETPGDAATAELRDLADTRAAIRGDDAASRRLLSSIALGLHVKGVLVVEAAPSGAPAARVFVAGPGAYDAVRYEADPPAPVTWGKAVASVTWNGAVTAIHRAFADAPPPVMAPPASAATGPATPEASLPATAATTRATPLATHAIVVPLTPPEAADKGKTRAFYQSPWFWAAAGAAVFAAGAVYFATRNDGSDNIQLQVQVPK